MQVLHRIIAALGIVLCMQCCSLRAETPLDTRVVIDNIGIPWEILWGPDNYLWITERQGRVSRVEPETGEATVLAVIPAVKQIGEGGLLGMALHPAFPTVPYVFLAYTYDANGATRVRVERYTYQPDTLLQPLTLVENIQGSGIHNGCRLLFAPDTTLLITTGDAADQSLPQRHDRLNGKVLRMNADGTIPADNPWPGSMLYSTGHRNSQGITWGPHGQLYSSEHGPANDDEVNLIVPGYNYGWPRVHGYCDKPEEKGFCRDSTVVEPMIAWTPTLAVCGMEYYNHPAIPEWHNSLLLTTLKASTLIQLELSEDGTRITRERRYFAGAFGRLRDICVAPDGRVFISTSNAGGNSIIEITARVPDGGWIRPSKDTLDMGSVIKGETTTTATVTLVNVGSGTAVLSTIELAGEHRSEFAVENSFSLPLSLAPHASTVVRVRFQPISTGEKRAELRITGDTEKPLVIVLRAARHGGIEVHTPPLIEFGQQLPHSKRDIDIPALLANVGEESVVVTSVSVAPPFFVVTPKELPIVLQPAQEIAAMLRFFPQREGTFTRRLLIVCQDGIQREILVSGKTPSVAVREEQSYPVELRIAPNPVLVGEAYAMIHAAVQGTARVVIHNTLGCIVSDTMHTVSAGNHTFVWDTKDTSGTPCPAGMYFATVTMDKQSTTRPLLLLR